MDKVRLAIVGCGTISQLNVPGYLEHPNCEVVALCDPERERAERRAAKWEISPRFYASYEDVLADPEVDAVELLTPTFQHPEQIVAGLGAGKHVSCQKPISATVAEVDSIAAAVARAKTKFRVTENFLFYPPIVKAKEMLDAGVIGDPSMVRIRTVRASLVEGSGIDVESGAYTWRRNTAANAGGLLYDDGWHKYATAMWWIGDVDKVYAMVTKTDDFIVESPSAIMWHFSGRDCLATFEYSSAQDMTIRGRYYPVDEFFEIQGSKGAIWVTRCTGEMLDMPPVVLVKGTETTGIQVPMDWIEGFSGSARHFIDCILKDEQPDMDVDFSRKVLQTALALYRSAEQDVPIDPRSLA